MDVAEDWKSILEVEYAKDKFSCEILMGLTMMIGIRCWELESIIYYFYGEKFLWLGIPQQTE